MITIHKLNGVTDPQYHYRNLGYLPKQPGPTAVREAALDQVDRARVATRRGIEAQALPTLSNFRGLYGYGETSGLYGIMDSIRDFYMPADMTQKALRIGGTIAGVVGLYAVGYYMFRKRKGY